MIRTRGSGLCRLGMVALLGLGAACNTSITTGPGDPDLAMPPDLADPFMGPFDDLPKTPVGAGGITADQAGKLASAFDAAMTAPSGGPCVTEPSLGALVPSNFSPLLFEWNGGAGQNVFELVITSENQRSPLRVYTDKLSFTPDSTLWKALVSHSLDRDLKITIRGGAWQNGVLSAVSAGSSGSVRIAPAAALGAIVYWTTSNGSALKGFYIGDSSVRTVVTPAGITAQGKTTACVGCHASAPDGILTFFARSEPGFSVDVRQVDGSNRGPTDITQNALTNLARTNQTLPTLSPGHYSASDAVVITSLLTNNRFELAWTDLRAQSGGTGILARSGDSRGAATPAWNHRGDTVAYSSASSVVDGRVDTGVGEVWTVPYADRKGGAATALAGATTADTNSYYPVYAPGDAFLAFNRNRRGDNMYNSASAEVFVIPAAGGSATRLASNDPPACGSFKSPGITNSWPRWAPDSTKVGARRYYWVVFSSIRRRGGQPQLFLSGVTTTQSETQGEVLEKTYPALYITTQPEGEANHTPAWDQFRIPGPG